MSWITIIDLLGTLVFAISGVLTSIEKKFDVVGSLVIGFVTALGGGTLRDVLIGNTPVSWLTKSEYLVVVFIGFLLSYFFRSTIVMRLRRSMFLFDTLGIGLFTILGIETTKAIGLSSPVCLLMGVVSAVFGGVIRDVLTGEIPLIFRKEIYATACLAGGLIYLLLCEVFIDAYTQPIMLVSMSVVFLIRWLAVKRGWSLNVHK